MTSDDLSHTRSGLQNGQNEFTITMTDSPNPADVEVVKQGLDSYNASQGAVVDWIPLALFARDAEGSIIAGLTGSTYWGYLYVGRLWTDDRFRKAGLGGRLLAEAEQEAQRRGCHSVHLMTGSFNALPFYLKRGYTVFGELQDMPIGHTQYFLCKSLKKREQSWIAKVIPMSAGLFKNSRMDIPPAMLPDWTSSCSCLFRTTALK